MVKVVFVGHDGTTHEAEGTPGTTIMGLAVSAGITGIAGDCGGFCNCATCHVYVSGDWALKLPALDEQEDAMLDGTVSERLENSRLGCQLVLTPDLDGITVALPERQTV